MVAALGEELVAREDLDGLAGALGVEQAQPHLGQVAAGAGGPFQVDGQLLGVGVGRLDAGGEGGQGGGELLGRLVEAAAGEVLQLLGLVRLGRDLGQRLDALAALGQTEVIEIKRIVGSSPWRRPAAGAVRRRAL